MDSTTQYFLIGSTFALLGAVVKLLYDSKCSKISCCCVEIERDIAHEVEIEEHKTEHHV